MDESRALREVVTGAAELVRTSSKRGPELRQMSSRAVGDSSCCRHGHQLDHPNKVVGGGDQVCGQSSPLQAAVARPAEATHRFHRAEDVFDALSDTLALAVPSMPCGASINRASPSTRVLCYVMHDAVF